MATEDDVRRSFVDFVNRATGCKPYPYQTRLAIEDLPEFLGVPTGTGKTVAGVLPWLFRRRVHPDLGVRATTPHWLVFVLPMRTLVNQTYDNVQRWLSNLELNERVGCHLLLGGEPRTSDWRTAPEQDSIIIGTLDMIVSRQLNRGYGDSRFVWPIDFGLFNSGCQFVFDEVQLMGPALATSRQLHGLRRKLGEASPCRSMWMSATIDPRAIATVDAPEIPEPVGLTPEDEAGDLARRLHATRLVSELVVDARKVPRDVATAVAARHRPGTLSLVIANTVAQARQTFVEMRRARPDVETVLLHSRYRPRDRQTQAAAALASVDPSGPGRVVVSTQVVEAGVDISARLLVTEAAPWPSIVQRAGRCNRDGFAVEPELLWLRPAKASPYEQTDVDASIQELSALEGQQLTSRQLGGRQVPVTHAPVPVLRRKDLIELFDTQPDLGGNDIDVSRFIRDADDLDVTISWRDFESAGPEVDAPQPSRDERCPVGVVDVRALIGDVRLWVYDHIARRWRRAERDDVRPGASFLMHVDQGRYSADQGWSPDVRLPVVPIEPSSAAPPMDDAAFEDDPASFGAGGWLPLQQHLADVEFHVNELLDAIETSGLSAQTAEAAVIAGRFHDIGKAHPAFQKMLRSNEADPAPPPDELLLAKSPHRRGTYEEAGRARFRHELVSALALDGEGAAALAAVDEPDLVRYLVAAHHGRIRLACRPHPKEQAGFTLGVADGETWPGCTTPVGALPMSALDLTIFALGRDDGLSWTARATALRDRADLGPFRLAFLEAMVRLADWRASAAPGSGAIRG